MSLNKKFLVPTAVLVSGLLGSAAVQASTQNLSLVKATESATVVAAPVSLSGQLPINGDLSGLVLTKNSSSGIVYAGHRSHSSHSSHRSHYSSR